MNYKIYALKLKDSDEIKYIGMTSKTIEERLHSHKKHTSRSKNKNGYWVKKYKEDIETILIEDNILTHKAACDREIYYIKLFKSFGAKLNNGTLGGDGVIVTDEVKRKMSLSRIARGNQPESVKEKIRNSCKGINKGNKTEAHKTALRKPKSKKYTFTTNCLYCNIEFSKSVSKNIVPKYCCNNHMKYFNKKK